MESERQDPSTFEYYSIEKILAKRYKNGTTEYLMKWKGFSSKYNSWEPEDHLTETLKTSEYVKRIREIRNIRSVRKVQPSSKIRSVHQASKARKTPTTRKSRVLITVTNLPRARTLRKNKKETQDKIESPVAVAIEPYYVINKFLARRKRNEKNEYLVSWKGYSPEESTWEPEYRLKEDYFNVTEMSVKNKLYK